ncbi:MAG: DUF3857 and transglutaminase domain-containing protein [Chitinophagaceae bacterium]|nr:DUF3857 and transglutaminase domain-containing protein [Chitinophagaceae bacterium]
MRTYLIFLLCLLQASSSAFAQDKTNVKFGNVKADDFKQTVYAIDSSAAAVVIADIGETAIVGNSKGWFSWEHVHFKRIHILNKSALDVSTVTISLYSNGDQEEELSGLKAYTYNLENGKVVETKLDAKKGVFKDKLSKNRVLRKFTLPNVKEGSIIEYQYKIKSDFLFNLQPWIFQGEHPALWSEYSVSIPQFISYVFLMQGYIAPHIKDKKDSHGNFTVISSGGTSASERYTFTSGVTTHRWVMKDVPVLKEESFTSSIANHISQIQFQLSEYKEPLQYRNVMGDWQAMAKRLREESYFGGDLGKNNGWIGDMIDPIIKEGGGQLAVAKRIFTYVQKNFTCTSSAGLYANENIRTIGRTKRGAVGEINLLLTAMMRYAGIFADPVILSTKSHGYTYAMYPLIDRFNYTISRIVVDDKEYLLDATNQNLGFGFLSPECYNGHARIIDAAATPLELTSDALQESKLTSVLMVNDEKGGMLGAVQKTPGYYESAVLRRKIRGSGLKDYMSEVQKSLPSEFQVADPVVDSLELLEMPVKLQYNFSIPESEEDIIYFNPMLNEAWKRKSIQGSQSFLPGRNALYF